jgi:hypothetical protein
VLYYAGGVLDGGGGRWAVGGPGGARAVSGLHDRRVRVPEDERPPRADEVDVPATVGVREVGAFALDEERRRAAYRTERAHGRVHAAGDDGGRPLEELC